MDYVGFYDKPFIKFERILETYFGIAQKGIKQYLSAIPIWLKDKLWTRGNIRKNLGYDGPALFSEHHESHAASAFYPSPFQEASILTMDGIGEWTTSSLALGKDNKIELLKGLWSLDLGHWGGGCRSILGDPRNPKMQSTMNLKIKYRESFRSFGLSRKSQ